MAERVGGGARACVVAAVWHPAVKAVIVRGIPALSPTGLGLFRIALGLVLLASVPGYSSCPPPRFLELHRDPGVFADGLGPLAALHPDINAAVLAIALGALALFAAGIVPRVAYVVAMLALTDARSLSCSTGLPTISACRWSRSWDSCLSRGTPPRQPGHEACAADERTNAHGYAVWWPGAVLGLGLLAAAYAKLDTSGVDWALGGAASYHFIEDFKRAPTTWGLWIATHPAWAVAASCGAIRRRPCRVHLFFRHRLVRATPAGGPVAAAGLYVLQGHFWPLWWTLLLAFVPWDVLAGILKPPMRDRSAFIPLSQEPHRAHDGGRLHPVVRIGATCRRLNRSCPITVCILDLAVNRRVRPSDQPEIPGLPLHDGERPANPST